MICPNAKCGWGVLDWPPLHHCPECGTYLLPCKPANERERVTDGLAAVAATGRATVGVQPCACKPPTGMV